MSVTHHPCDTMVVDNSLQVLVVNVNLQKLDLWELLTQLLIDGCDGLACDEQQQTEIEQPFSDMCGTALQSHSSKQLKQTALLFLWTALLQACATQPCAAAWVGNWTVSSNTHMAHTTWL